MEKNKFIESPDKIHYQERLKDLYSLYYEVKIEKSLVSENVKDAIHDAFLKLYQTNNPKTLNIINGDNKLARGYIDKMICNLLVDGIKAIEEQVLYSENFKHDINNSHEDSEEKIIKNDMPFTEHVSVDNCVLPDDYEIKEKIRDSFEKLKEFINTRVPLNQCEQKLLDLLCKKEPPRNIMKKMGYSNIQLLYQSKHLLIKKIKKYKDRFKFTIYDFRF